MKTTQNIIHLKSKQPMKKTIIYFSLGLFFLASCGKYEEGPSLSLRAKKARLVGEWSIDAVTEDGVDITAAVVTALGSDAKLHIEKDETYHVHGLAEDEGTWKFGDKKETVIFQSNVAGAEAEDYTILKLKNNELWLKHVHTDGTLIYHYKQ